MSAFFRSALFALCLLGLLTGGRSAAGQVPSSAEPLNIPSEDAEQKEGLVNAPEGFTVDLFAAPPDVNYPTAITATPGGDLFVAVDKNGSLDQEYGRGTILKVLDADGDGQGDHYTTFVDSVDSPRGLVYDGTHLYVMHPPTLTVFTDTTGDGTADRSQTLLTGLGYGLDFRGADHTTNGMQMGIDGWLYIAVGDYGFYDAEGTDGRRIQNRSGGVVRVRPDGSELEIYATGLRNPYDIAVDPYLNGFERGNTNDGYGWDTRLQHIVPGAEYGYPSLFLHFADEVKPPLADYGGGSGAGALYVNSSDVPDSLDGTLFTADWGRGVVYRHDLRPNGATFDATQDVFTRIPQPTDLTIDARSHLYISSWMGGGYTYGGEDVGFIARLTTEHASSNEAPNFGTARTEELLQHLTSSHSLIRRHAQRELLRRTVSSDVTAGLKELIREDEGLGVRIAALFTLKQVEGADCHPFLRDILDDASLRPYVLRALADRTPETETLDVDPFVRALNDADPRTRLEAVHALGRMEARAVAHNIVPLTADPDRTVAHVAQQVLVDLEAVRPALHGFRDGSPALIEGARTVLERLPTAETVEGLTTIWKETDDPYLRRQSLGALARLYHTEADWEREDWWGTTPSPRGPYHDPVPSAHADDIRPVLRTALSDAEGFEFRRRVFLLERNRAVPDGAGSLLLTAGHTSDSLKEATVDVLVEQATVTEEMGGSLERLAGHSPAFQRATIDLLTTQPTPPATSVDLLRTVAFDTTQDASVRGRELRALGKISEKEVLDDIRTVYAQLIDRWALASPVERAVRAYVSDGARADGLSTYETLAENGTAADQTLAYAVLLQLAQNDYLDEAAERANDAVEDGWETPGRRAPLLRAIGFTQTEGYADEIRRSLTDDEHPEVQDAARYAATRLDLSPTGDGD